MFSNDRFKKGFIYEINLVNGVNQAVGDDSRSIINGDILHMSSGGRYSIYGIKLTDSCLNAIMDFLKAKTNDPSHCVSQLEIIKKNNIPSCAKISFEQTNLKEKVKVFNLKTIKDSSSVSIMNTQTAPINMLASSSTNTDNSSQQDLIMGVKFSNDYKKMLSVGNINFKLVVMGNNDAFDMTMKKIETQVKRREQSKAKCIKSSTTKSGLLTNRKVLPIATIGNKSSINSNGNNKLGINSLKNSLVSVTSKNIAPTIKKSSHSTPSSTSAISKLVIRNISKPKNDSKPKILSEYNSTIDTNFSLKDHAIFNLLLSPMTLDTLCEKISKDTKREISSTTIFHLIKSMAKYDDETKTYSLTIKPNKSIQEIQNWPYYSSEEKKYVIDQMDILNTKVINTTNGDETKNNCIRSHFSDTTLEKSNSNKLSINGKDTENKATKRPIPGSHSKSHRNDKVTKSIDKTYNDYDFCDKYPPISSLEQYKNYINLYESEYPLYLSKKTKLDNLTASIKSIRDYLNKNPKDIAKRNQLVEHQKKLDNNSEFQHLYNETKYIHYKLAHIKSLIKNFTNSAPKSV